MKMTVPNFAALVPGRRQPGSTVLGLALDGSRLEGALVRRTNGSVEVRKSFTATLSLDPLTNAPELVGRELRKLLDEQGITERWVALALPAAWTLTLTVPLPDLPEADVASFLQLEAERGFPYGPEALIIQTSRFTAPDGARWATLLALPRTHLTRLEAVLAAAQLRPAHFSLGLPALQPPGNEGVLSLLAGESAIALQVALGGGLAAFRTIEGAFEPAGTGRALQADHVLRELRITLGQLPDALRPAVTTLRVLGRDDAADELAETLAPRATQLGLKLERVRAHTAEAFGVKVPVNTAISPALAVAVRRLTGAGAALEFLPPKVTAWQQFAARYSSPKLVAAGAAAALVVVLVAGAFAVQQVRLWYWGSKWNAMKQQVFALEDIQTNIRTYRPWFNESFRELSILKRITEAFPEDGQVSVKTVEIRDPNKPGEMPTVTCTGTALNRAALTRVTDRLGTNRAIVNVRTEQTRGTSPMEFTFNFQWSEGSQ
jgi:hypothetical protein